MATKTKTPAFTLPASEVDRYCQEWSKDPQYVPKRLEILRDLISEAWGIVCYMTEAGLKLRSSSLEEAALTIAGCAYAEWRHAQPDNPDIESTAETEIVRGFNEGIMWAMWQGDGMPALPADSYTFIAQRSDSVIDRMIPIQAIEKLFPDMVKDGKLTLEHVGVQPFDPDARDAYPWTHRPNILTNSFEDVKEAERKYRRRSAARMKKKAAPRRRSTTKPRAK